VSCSRKVAAAMALLLALAQCACLFRHRTQAQSQTVPAVREDGEAKGLLSAHVSKEVEALFSAHAPEEPPAEKFEQPVTMAAPPPPPPVSHKRMGAGAPSPTPVRHQLPTSSSPSTMPPSSQTPPQSPDDIVQGQLTSGQIAFQPPQTMQEGKSETIQVRISRGLNQQITQGLARTGETQPVTLQNIDVAPRMTVKLQGPDFTITPLTADEQAITETDYTTWEWAVQPLHSGVHDLYLSVGVTLKVDGQDALKFYPVYDKQIRVRVDRMYEAKGFVSANWQWLAATFVIPLLGIVWKFATKRPAKQTPLEP